MNTPANFNWLGIVRLGLVQTALGAIVVLCTSTLNRVMVVELGLIATLPGALVALHYAVQLLRPRFGYGSDIGGRRTPWIVGGMVALALGAIAAAFATALMAESRALGIALAVFAFLLVGLGVGAAGTSVLVLLATRVVPERRSAAATIVWTMMIVGFALSAGGAGYFLDPFSFGRLVLVTTTVALSAVLVTILAMRGLEGPTPATAQITPAERPAFGQALAEVWREPRARLFTVFVFVSMLAYSAQDLILEPFAGQIFGFTPGESTTLSGLQHAGVLLGMLMVPVLGSSSFGQRWLSQRVFTTAGCIASGTALALLAAGGLQGPPWPVNANVFALGVANGCFAVSAVGAMMMIADSGRARRAGVRMGLWGAAQAIAVGAGGLLGTVAVDALPLLVGTPAAAYSFVFASEAVLFAAAALLAAHTLSGHTRRGHDTPQLEAARGFAAAWSRQ